MLDYLRRLIATGAAYQFGDIVAKGLALLTLPLYTHHISPGAYGAAESLLTAVILASILLRAGGPWREPAGREPPLVPAPPAGLGAEAAEPSGAA